MINNQCCAQCVHIRTWVLTGLNVVYTVNTGQTWDANNKDSNQPIHMHILNSLFVCADALHPSQQFFSTVGCFPVFLG